MASSRARRVTKELADIYNDRQNSGVSADPASDGDMTHLKGTLTGPPDTPYAGGKFVVDIKIPDGYPFKPPQIRFDTKVWHPNISSQTGAICLDTLGTAWSPVQTIKTALISLRMLLEVPNPKDPQDAEVAKMMMEDPGNFAIKAHEWAVMHASAPRQPKLNVDQYKSVAPKTGTGSDPQQYHGYHPNMINRFVNMGFEIDHVVEAFEFVGIERMHGQEYEMEEAYIGDITAYLLGEQ
ncbi:ubiquitin-conjugating enzyme [Zalerion maritima]|uniref:Ubiquitin-conjugating enzyme E2 1 n=1 Tax=Zalerion maritima TaxID=339359 RepID=A0AAD5RUZ5_9PEZI|nr:ubiquitin-conjugating enzyme [Zalerion maritima]